LLSLHVITRRVLDHVLVSSTPRLLAETAGARRTVQDYREQPKAHREHLRTFAGLHHYLNVGSVPVADGFLRSSSAYRIDELDAYCPGFYQMMLIPQPVPLWDNLHILPVLDGFRDKLAERLAYEVARQPHMMLRLSFAHVRREMFAPRIIRSLDTAY
jgi:hypothetical protein